MARGRVDGGRLVLGLTGLGVAAYLMAPLLSVLAASFSSGDYISLPPEGPLSLRWYRTFLQDPLYQHALRNSLIVAGAVALLAVSVGTSAAIGFTRRRFRGQEALHFLMFLPFLMPGIVLGIGLAVSLRPLGLESLRGSLPVIVVGHLLWATPLVFVIVVAKLRELDPDLEAAALSLGATPVRVTREVTVPLLAPALFAGAILAFVVSLHDFAMALFLVGPDTTTLPVLVWNSLRFEVRPIIAAIDSIMVASVIGALVALGKLVGLDKITLG